MHSRIMPCARDSLPRFRKGHDHHDSQHDRDLQHKAGIDAEQGGALRHGEGCQCDGHAADQHQIEHVCAHDVAKGQIAAALDQRGDGGDQLRQRGAQRHKGQRDDRLRHAQCLCDEGAVIHQQVCAQCDEHSAQHQQYQRFGKGHLFPGIFGLGLRFGGGRGFFHLQYVCHHVGHEHGQHHKAQRAGELAHGVGSHAVDGGCGKEEGYRHPQGLGVYLARTDGDGDGGDQGRVADDRADGVAVGDLTMAGHSGHGGHHDLRQSSADGHHRCADEQLRQMEPPCQCRSTVHEPVAALDQEQQTDDK